MSSYLLDTDICIFLIKGKYGLGEKVQSVGIESCSISEITIAELHYGAAKSEFYHKHLDDVKKTADLFSVIPIFNCLPMYGIERARLEQAGKRIPDFDLLIGATAIENDLIMVTNNEKHLGRMAGITIENWTLQEFNEFVIS